MKLLFVGDSITEGITGVGYVQKIQKLMPYAKVDNLGLGGDTLIGITNRLIEHLKTDSDYDAIVIEAGHNDLLVPVLETQSMPYRVTAMTLKARGSTPIEEVEAFKKVYRTTLKAVLKLTRAKCFVTTLSCMGEKLSTPINLKRAAYNKAISSLVEEMASEVHLIDVGKRFDAHLIQLETTPYLLDDFFSNFVKDAHNEISEEAASELSQKRGLFLTIDGVHLNGKGAALYTEIIYASLVQFFLSNVK